MPAKDTGSEAHDDQARDGLRSVARISGDYVLRSLALLGGLAYGDVFEGLLTLTIVQVNVGHLSANQGSQFTDSHDPPPDEVRRPATVQAVAQNLGLPYETVRRQIRRLEAKGHCKRVPGGVIVPTQVLLDAGNQSGLEANLANLRQMYRSLRAAGISLD